MIFNGWQKIALILGITLFTACASEEPPPVRRTQFIMGTLVEITVSHADENVANLAMVYTLTVKLRSREAHAAAG